MLLTINLNIYNGQELTFSFAITIKRKPNGMEI